MKYVATWSSVVMAALFISLSMTSCGNDADSSTSESAQESSVQTEDRESSVQTENSGAPPANARDLMTASLKGRVKQVRQALEEGVDANAADEKGNTPLMLASYNGHTEVVQQLLDREARLDARNAEGRTALMFAATGSFPKTVEVLLGAGADPNATGNVEGWSALMFATAEGHREVVQTLLDHGADPSLKDKDGDTALTFAQNNNHSEVAALLERAQEK